MSLEQTLQVVQVSFPQIYLACHTRHQRKRSTEHRLSQRDASILAHLDERTATPSARLARHFGIARSTLSEALKRLSALGFVRPAPPDGARAGGAAPVVLTAKGARAIRETSVLETRLLRSALEGMSAKDLETVRAGMKRLAAACRAMEKPSTTEPFA